MLQVLFIFAFGILIGYVVRNHNRVIKANDYMTNFAIYLLLFLLGLGVGSNKDIIENVDIIGFNAFLISVFAVAGSVFFAWIVNKFIFKSKS